MNGSVTILKRSKKLLSRKKTVSKASDNDVQFEKDWQNAISGDEFVKRVHQHIDELYKVERDNRYLIRHITNNHIEGQYIR